MKRAVQGDASDGFETETLIQEIQSDIDIIAARQMGRQLSETIGFNRPSQALIATAISELARNIVKFANSGVVEVRAVIRGGNQGIQIVVRDDGPGIDDVEAALRDGFSTVGSLGLGLPGTRRIMDEFELTTAPGNGVSISTVKWVVR